MQVCCLPLLQIKGDIWFTENRTNKIGKLTVTGEITEYTLPNSDSGPFGITRGHNGDIWFTEMNVIE